MITESFSITPTQQLIQQYAYLEYSDDTDITAFVNSFNSIAQTYLDWFNQTPLSVYTSAGINGQLLDWVADGIYGINRPTLSNQNTVITTGMNNYAMNTQAMNALNYAQTGVYNVVSDDIFKRVLTWYLYKNDGEFTSIEWLRRRVARFIYGANGADIDNNSMINVHITLSNAPTTGAMDTRAMNTLAMNTLTINNGTVSKSLTISVPASQMATTFAQLVQQGYLAMPFQVTYKVVTT